MNSYKASNLPVERARATAVAMGRSAAAPLTGTFGAQTEQLMGWRASPVGVAEPVAAL